MKSGKHTGVLGNLQGQMGALSLNDGEVFSFN